MSRSDSNRPLVTIAMPVFNVERTVLDAIESIRLQTLEDWELIVMDDGSTDSTPAILGRVRDPRVRVVLHSRNAGLGQRLNECVAMARGNYIARLDGDDVAYPERLQTQHEYLANADVDLVGSGMILLDPDRRAFGKWQPPEDHARITARAYHSILVAHPTYFGHREWFVKNPYSVDFIRAEDQLLLMDTAPRSTFANVQQILVGYQNPPADIRSVMRRRASFCANAARYFVRSRRYGSLLRNLVTHGGIAVLECVAELTRLRHRLLVHRVAPLAAAEKDRWQQVWSAIKAAKGSVGDPAPGGIT